MGMIYRGAPPGLVVVPACLREQARDVMSFWTDDIDPDDRWAMSTLHALSGLRTVRSYGQSGRVRVSSEALVDLRNRCEDISVNEECHVEDYLDGADEDDPYVVTVRERTRDRGWCLVCPKCQTAALGYFVDLLLDEADMFASSHWIGTADASARTDWEIVVGTVAGPPVRDAATERRRGRRKDREALRLGDARSRVRERARATGSRKRVPVPRRRPVRGAFPAYRPPAGSVLP